ncbi:EAL domain-containing protein [Oxalobacteraceae bacterium R-40]|uniref:EAL domain-containing protein n=1 Tax=Keguizhuia sedimenti TaxID=3064264 RepID=A0ABU1BSA8_9BURK|nr:EAL domain-containing protein [Oxalobacteraceae bacterium R-40]
MQSSYNFFLVGLSLFVASLASYVALDVSGRISLLGQGRQRYVWLAGGAFAMGIGIWSMHFIGMLAFSLPIPIGYDFGLTCVSLLIAIAISYSALSVIARPILGPRRLITGGTLIGLGIASMHYLGMEAMRMMPGISYRPGLFALSIAIAIGAASAALWIARTLNNLNHSNVLFKRVLAALVMGTAIAGMHYTGMAAAHFEAGSVCRAANGADAQWLAVAISLFTLAILSVTILLSRYDARTAQLAGSVSHLSSKILHMASFDTLTDLTNRSALTHHIEAAMQTSRRSQKMFAILFMDLNGFKLINDSLGHSAGDEVLKAFAERLKQCVRSGDTVARWGGDEFVILMENLSAPEDAGRLASSVMERMRQGVWADKQPIQIIPSIGISLFPKDGETMDELLKHADTAMYEAKNSGNTDFLYFEKSMTAAAMRSMQIQQALREALDLGHFSLMFQPKFRGGDNELTGVEALLRLNHPQLGILAPADFIPIAERTGQIVAIGYWVVRQSCRQIRQWEAAGLIAPKVAVNLSARQLLQTDLVETMLDIVRTEQVSCSHLMFEITETVAMQDASKTSEIIHGFQDLGFDMAIDDFGTGYSSLAYLQRFRAKQLKIDRFFTNGLDTHSKEGSAIVSAIIALAHALEMEVVAEGVETTSQLDKLQALHCDQVQGFLLGKPIAPEAIGALLQERVSIPEKIECAEE